MNYTNDDVDTRALDVMGFLGDPLINSQINNLARSAAMMGVDLSDPGVMAGFFDDLNAKVKSMFGGKTITVETGKGTAQVGPGGISYVTTTPGAQITPQAKTGGITDLLKNPYILAAIIGVPVLLLLMNTGRRKQKTTEG